MNPPLPGLALFGQVPPGAYAGHGILMLGSLICFIIVVIEMFGHGRVGLGIATIVLGFCCGIGSIIAFIVGWVNADRWNLRIVMLIWTAIIIVNIILYVFMPIPIPQETFQRVL